MTQLTVVAGVRVLAVGTFFDTSAIIDPFVATRAHTFSIALQHTVYNTIEYNTITSERQERTERKNCTSSRVQPIIQ